MTAYARRNASDYSEGWRSLLPTGPAWPIDPESKLMQLLDGQSVVWAQIDGRAHDLLDIESRPDLTSELLPEWERTAGLPEECFRDVPQTTDARRSLLVRKLTSEGGQSRAYFLQLASELGYPDAVITEFTPFRPGRSRCGAGAWRIGSPLQRYVWRMHVGDAPYSYFRVGRNRVGRDPQVVITRAIELECLVRKWKPGHTDVVFLYTRGELVT